MVRALRPPGRAADGKDPHHRTRVTSARPSSCPARAASTTKELQDLELQLASAAPDSPAPAPGELAATAAPPQIDPVEETRAMIDAVLDLAQPFAPEWIDRYGPDQRQRVAQSFTVLAIKHGWNVSAWLGDWAEEIAFAMAVSLPVLPVIRAKLAPPPAPPAPKPAPQPASTKHSGSVDLPAAP
jgi:hypothetical protein